MIRDGVPFVRRQSGGGTVYHDLGNANYSLIVPKQQFSLSAACDLLVRALSLELDIPEVWVHPKRHDLWLTGRDNERRKISGSAYRVVKHAAFHHGTMLIQSSAAQSVDQYLHPRTRFLGGETKQIDDNGLVSQAVRSVGSRVGCLEDVSLTVTYQLFCRALAKQFLVMYGGNPNNTSAFKRLDVEYPIPHVDELMEKDMLDEHEEVAKTVAEMRTFQWRYGLTPDFFQQVGDAKLKIHRGAISEVEGGAEWPDDVRRALVGTEFLRERVRETLVGVAAYPPFIDHVTKHVPPELPL